MKRQAWTILVVFTAMNLLNYLDRMVVPAVQESIKHEMGLSDAQIGFLATAFLVVYLLTAPVFGALATTWSRTRVIALGVAIWSLATAAGGLAANYGQLLAARAAVGVGEAAYGTLAPAVLADLFPERMRGRIFALFYMAIPVGSALGYVLSGQVAKHYDWRAAFFVAGAPGLLFALLSLMLADPPTDDDSGMAAPKGFDAYVPLFRNAPYVRTVVGYIAYTFALGGIAVWMPAFLVRIRGMDLATANTQLGEVLVVTGFVGTFVGGWVADAVAKRTRQANLWVSGVTTLAAAPFAWLAFVTPNTTTFWAALIVAELLVFMSTGPINAAIVSEVAPALRAAAMALSIFAIHLLGDAISPSLIGWISDVTNLGRAVLIIPAAVLVSGVVWIYAARKG
jgi:MFS transporter, Spinster family, sphingosine-1-phosphate transporter